MDRFSIISFSHMTCQEVRNKRQTIGMHTENEELKGRIRGVIKDLEGTIQKEDKVMMHSRGEEHNDRLRKLLAKLHGRDRTLKINRCKLTTIKTTWSEHT